MIDALALALTLTLTTPTEDRTVHPSRSDRATVMTGIGPSLYQGKWYDPADDDRRRCILARESHGNYRAANSTSSARGGYQFLDSQWRDSLVWMMLADEPKPSPHRREIRELRDQPIHTWNRYWQDRAFWTVWRYGDGAHHWAYPPKPC